MLITTVACADPNSTSRQTIELPAGVLTRVHVLIPPGHFALARLRVLRGATQVIPWRGWLSGDSESFSWSEYIELDEKETFTVEVRNDDIKYKHCFYLRFEIQPKLIAAPHLTILSTLKKLMEALGIE